MPTSANLAERVNQEQDELIWGDKALAKVLNRTPRQVNHLIATGRLKSVKKFGGKHVGTARGVRRDVLGAG
jgi:hypothetical protein